MGLWFQKGLLPGSQTFLSLCVRSCISHVPSSSCPSASDGLLEISAGRSSQVAKATCQQCCSMHCSCFWSLCSPCRVTWQHCLGMSCTKPGRLYQQTAFICLLCLFAEIQSKQESHCGLCFLLCNWFGKKLSLPCLFTSVFPSEVFRRNKSLMMAGVMKT